jgi:hypothetical protein
LNWRFFNLNGLPNLKELPLIQISQTHSHHQRILCLQAACTKSKLTLTTSLISLQLIKVWLNLSRTRLAGEKTRMEVGTKTLKKTKRR